MTAPSSDSDGALGGAAGVDAGGGPSLAFPGAPDIGGPSKRDAEFEAAVEGIRRRVGSNAPFLFPRIEDQIRRWLGVAPISAGSFVLAGLTGFGIRFAVAIAATGLAGDWAGVPWGRWAAILGFLALWDGGRGWGHPAGDVPRPPSARRLVEDSTALVSTIVRTSAVQELSALHRRWYRLPLSAPFGATVAFTVLMAGAVVAPAGIQELPLGSVVVLAFLVYDLAEGVVYAGNLVDLPFMAREARYDHHLFWLSPADTPAIQKQMRMLRIWPVWFGIQITVYLGLAVLLVTWDSPLVPPLALGFVVVGYLTTISSALSHRASIRRIIRRSKDRHLETLQKRIDPFKSHYTELSARQSEQLRALIDLHNMIRDAPTAPTTTRTLIRAAVGLIIPTIMFIITVFGEVYAERFLDAILP